MPVGRGAAGAQMSGGHSRPPSRRVSLLGAAPVDSRCGPLRPVKGGTSSSRSSRPSRGRGSTRCGASPLWRAPAGWSRAA
eukprot:9328748-Alexandrium_andersonii.AAC.1